MTIYANIKKAGSKRNILKKKPYETELGDCSTEDIIRFFVSAELSEFRNRAGTVNALKYLSEKDIDLEAASGKVGFDYADPAKIPDEEDALKNAIECYDDGLMKIFHNETELLTKDQGLTVKDGDEFTFIRLTFLTGRMW